MKGLKKISAFLLAVIMSVSIMNVSLVSASAATNEPAKVFSTNDGIFDVSSVSNQKGTSSTLPLFERNSGNNTAVLDTSEVAGSAFTSGDFARFFGGATLAAESFTAENMEADVMYRKWAFKFEENFVSTRFGIRWGDNSWKTGVTADNDLFVVDAAGKLSFAGINDSGFVYGENLVLGTKYTVEAVIDMRGTARTAEFYVTAEGQDRKFAGTVSIAGSPSADYEKLSFASFVYVYASTKSGDSTVIQNLKMTLSDVEGYLGSPVPLSAKAPIKAFSSNDGITGNYSSSWQKTTTLPKYTQNSGNNTFCLDTTAKLDAAYVSGNKARLYYGDNLTSGVFTAENMEELVMYRKWTFKFETNLVSTDFGIRWGATNFSNAATGTVDRVLFNVCANGVISFKDKDNSVAFTYDEAVVLGEEYTVEAVIDMRGSNSIADFYVTKGSGTRNYAGWLFTKGSNATDAQYTKLSFSSFAHTYAYKPGESTKTQATKVTLSNLEAYLGSPIPASAKGTVKVFSSDDDMKDFAASNLKGTNSVTPKFVKDATNKVATLTTLYGADYVAGDVERLFYGATPSVYFTTDNMESNVMYRSWTFKFEDKFVRTRFGVRWGNTAWVTGETADVELFEVGYDGVLIINGENDTGLYYDKTLELDKEYTVEAVIDMRGENRKAEFFLSQNGGLPVKIGETTTRGGGLAATEKKAFASFVFTEAFVPEQPTVTQGTTITVSNIKAYLGSPITEVAKPDYTIGKIRTYINSVEDAAYANGDLKVKALVENNISEPRDVVIIAALYSKTDDALLAVDAGEYSVKKDEPVDIEASLNITDYENTYVMVMLLDTMSNIKPYRQAKLIGHT